MKSKLFLLSLGTVATLAARGQSVGPSDLVVAGGSKTTGTLTHEYAIGQVAAGPTAIKPNLVVTPGVLQPFTPAPAGVRPQSLTAAELRVYPNPVTTALFLEPALGAAGTLSYALYDAAGKQVAQQTAPLQTGSERQQLELTPLAAGTYNLQVRWLRTDGTTATTAYKIQKLR